MQEKSTIFENTPYETRALKGTPLSPEHAQEALQDVLSDTSVFLEMPSSSDILKVRSESVYGVHKLIVTLPQGAAFPEYMLNARVVALEPKLVNVMFEVGALDEIEEVSMPQMQEPSKPHHTAEPKDISILTLTCSKLGVTYPEFAEIIGYEAKDVIAVLSAGDVPAPMRRAIEFYLENLELKKELEASARIKAALKEWLN